MSFGKSFSKLAKTMGDVVHEALITPKTDNERREHEAAKIRGSRKGSGIGAALGVLGGAAVGHLKTKGSHSGKAMKAAAMGLGAAGGAVAGGAAGHVVGRAAGGYKHRGEWASKHAAEKEKKTHFGSRFFMGNPASAAYHAKKGKGEQAFSEASGHFHTEHLKGLGKGALYGAGAGTAGAAGVAAHHLAKHKTLKGSGRKALLALLGGTAVGASAGETYGLFKGHLGEQATKIHQKYQAD